MYFYFLIYVPPVLGALVALAVAIMRGRFTLFRVGSAGFFAVASAIVVIGLSLLAMGLWPVIRFNDIFLDGVMTLSFTPLILGVLGALIIAFTPTPKSNGTAELMPRSGLPSEPRSWFNSVLLVLLLILLTSLWAGELSSPDEWGLYRIFKIEPNATFMVGSSFYGWYYSKWAVLIIVALLLLGVWRLQRIRNGAGTQDTRRAFNRVILAMIAGALLLHLAQITTSLSNAGALQASALIDNGYYTFQSSLAAMTIPLRWASYLLKLLGWAAWFTVLFSPGPAEELDEELA